jgi:hypothetical protein
LKEAPDFGAAIGRERIAEKAKAAMNAAGFVSARILAG